MTIDRGAGEATGPEDCTGPEDALHDSVIQRLYATGLQLQSALARISDPIALHRVRQAVHVLDEVIGDIRSALRHDGR